MTQEKALAVQEEQALQAQIEAMGGLAVAGDENLERGDIGMPPRLRISQPNRPIPVGDEEASPGSIVNTVTGEIFENGIEIVPLVFLPKTRVMWPVEFSTENDPLCASDNGKDPSASGEQRKLTSPQRGPCAECPSSKFGADGSKPACMSQRNFLAWLVDSQEPAILTMQSTALTVARGLTSLAKTQGLKKTIMLTTQKQSDSRGQWFVPAVTRGRKLESSDLLLLLEARNELQNLVITADVEIAAESESNPHAPTAEESKMPWDNDDDVDPPAELSVEPKPDTTPTRPPVPEAPPSLF